MPIVNAPEWFDGSGFPFIQLIDPKDYDLKKTCSFCFFADIRLYDRYEWCVDGIEKKLKEFAPYKKEISSYIETLLGKGYTHFLIDVFCGLSNELLEILMELKKTYESLNIIIEAIYPAKDRISHRMFSHNYDRQTVLYERMEGYTKKDYCQSIAKYAGATLCIFNMMGVGVFFDVKKNCQQYN